MKAGVILSVNPALIRESLGRFRWSEAAVSRAVSRATGAFKSWAAWSFNRRAQVLKKFREALSKNQYRLAMAITLETGKALWESKEEAAALLNKIDITIKDARSAGVGSESETPTLGAPGVASGQIRDAASAGAFYTCRPYGVAAVLGPFNFPLHLPHGHIVPALLAGNTVIFKPSDKASFPATIYAECAASAGFPEGVIQVVYGPASVGEALVVHPGVSMVLFTGSCSVGERISRLAFGATEKILALEMGGKNAAVIFPDADLSTAAQECARAAYATSGQRCTSTSRIFAHRAIFEKFSDEFVRAASGLRVGNPLDPEVFCGPLISEDAALRAESAIREAGKLGGEPILPGGRFDFALGHFVRLSAHRFRRYPGRARYTAEELFVPEVGLYPFSEAEEAVRLADDTDYGLALAVFTRRRALFDKLLNETAHGVVNWNIGTIGASGRLPFGGRKKSGNARPAAAFAIRNCVYPVSARIR